MKKRNVQEDFITAFGKLYQNKRIEKISIRELCELAGYNRTTFYVYYKDIYDLFDKFIEDLISPILEEIKDIKNLKDFRYFKDIKDFNLTQTIYFSMFNRNSMYLYSILKNNNHYILEEKIMGWLYKIMKENFKVKEDSYLLLSYAIRYQISAISGVLKFWYEQNNNELSKEELSNLLFEISNQGVLNIIKNSTLQY